MPDLINPEFNNGEKELVRWTDELCISCKVANCPLMQAMYQFSILTHSGTHVASCELYDPDVDSEFYVPPDASVEARMEANIAAFEQEIGLLNRVLMEITQNVDIQ